LTLECVNTLESSRFIGEEYQFATGGANDMIFKIFSPTKNEERIDDFDSNCNDLCRQKMSLTLFLRVKNSDNNIDPRISVLSFLPPKKSKI
jgi:hypothetical protein